MSKFWLSDFEFQDGTVLVKKTGHHVPLNVGLVRDVLVGISFTLKAGGSAYGTRPPETPYLFLPHTPRPWYLYGQCFMRLARLLKKTRPR